MSFLASVGAGGENNEILHIPSGKVGKLIGKGGSTIKDIQARGGARVKIDHEVGSVVNKVMRKHQIPVYVEH